MERALDLKSAVVQRDPKELWRLAQQEMKEGNEEYAEALMDMYNEVIATIKEVKEEMMFGDEEDYKAEREAEKYEAHRDFVNE